MWHPTTISRLPPILAISSQNACKENKNPSCFESQIQLINDICKNEWMTLW
jgi:hypothetical protein